MKIQILIIVLIFANSVIFSQSEFKKDVLSFQKEMNEQYSDTANSPLLKEDLTSFKSLDFFPINEKYRVVSKIYKTFNPVSVILKTTTDRAPKYKVYGVVEFVIDDQKIKLNVYQSERLSKDEEYKDYLFLPFTDLTNGKTSYGGGRYVDLTIPEGDIIIIDFNKSYNPYCAYNHKYSCVVPPADNVIQIMIKAGVKYTGHKE